MSNNCVTAVQRAKQKGPHPFPTIILSHFSQIRHPHVLFSFLISYSLFISLSMIYVKTLFYQNNFKFEIDRNKKEYEQM